MGKTQGENEIACAGERRVGGWVYLLVCPRRFHIILWPRKTGRPVCEVGGR